MCPVLPSRVALARRRWCLRGQVQGVGFRPFVYRLAHLLRLTGHVCNDADGVIIEVQGPAAQLDRFGRDLVTKYPPLAALHAVQTGVIALVAGETDFRILPSGCAHTSTPAAAVAVDTAVCPDCLAELHTPADARHRYGLINCTNCGPRFSIIRSIPYDRPNTTMASFAMCDRCAAQYADPSDRRFHAQPIACPDCGPQVTIVDPHGRAMEGDPYITAARALAEGRTIAIKGIGGFHLAVRADDDAAIARLRAAKHRDNKPLAVMARDLHTAQRLVSLTPQALQALTSPQRPIVLAPAKRDAPVAAVAPGIAPQSHRLGAMLPYTPMQHLLFDELDPSIHALVMTSGNVTDEPIATDNADALHRLGPLCDLVLWHDRPIERCVDDSVLLAMRDGHVMPLRRSRGYAPGVIDLPIHTDEPGLCVGGELKNTVAVVRGGQVIVSQHLGDLSHPLAFDHFRQAVGDLCDLFEVEPRWIAADLHPVYLSRTHACELARRWDVPLHAVQHHHAHAAAALAEHGMTGPALAVVCDGVGYGEDGDSWGGELFLLKSLDHCERLAHLRPLRLPGGDAAARDTRRCALALMYQALGDDFAAHPMVEQLIADTDERAMLTTMVRRDVQCTASSGAGRLFDAAAALTGVCLNNDHEAQAPMALESLAAAAPAICDGNEKHYSIREGVIDMSPTWALLTGDAPIALRAAAFHEQLAAAFAEAAINAAARTQVRDVVLTGGCLCNERFAVSLAARLRDAGLCVLQHETIPPGDGGIAFGQAAIVSAMRKAGA